MLATVFAACNNKPEFLIEGTVSHAADSVLYLEANTLDGLQTLDSVQLDANGTFRLKATAPTLSPEFFSLRIGNDRIPFSVDSTETITIQASLPNFSADYTISGNESSQKIQEIARLQNQLQERIIQLEKNEDMYPGDIIDSIHTLILSYKEQIKEQYIFPDAKSASAYYAVCQCISVSRGLLMVFSPTQDRDDVKAYAAVATAWDCYYPDAPRTVQLCNAAIKGLDNTAPPRQRVIDIDSTKIHETSIIEVELPDLNSRLRRLTDLKGKVVLLDFTVFATKESAARTRQLRTLYEQYHAKGLEIYQVSLDEDIHFWKTSVEYLPWISVHETDGHAVNSYGISNLPTFFLINRRNEIVLRSDFMEGTLESNLLRLLNE